MDLGTIRMKPDMTGPLLAAVLKILVAPPAMREELREGLDMQHRHQGRRGVDLQQLLYPLCASCVIHVPGIDVEAIESQKHVHPVKILEGSDG
mmetsp:Transcript_119780/g.207130  ORF Transcript_119780/g.207130 Transcript_119780/m.207130 type:complete len:93 (-) Transcript_119780:74-352(-)